MTRGKTVLLAYDYGYQTWEWDGVSWNNVTPNTASQSPEFSGGQIMLFHGGRGKVLLFGNYTWEWSGTSWTIVTFPTYPNTGSYPPSGIGASLVYDSARGKIVYFTDVTTSGTTGMPVCETWEWDGIWSKINPAKSPPARSLHAMAYDSKRGRSILFAGGNTTGLKRLNDTWSWDGSNWTDITPTVIPPARRVHSMAFDRARGKTVLFGGMGINSEDLNDTWEWDGTAWNKKSPVTMPPAGYGHMMAYDEAREKIVLFGGASTLLHANGYYYTAYNDQTWEWNGSTWTKLNPVNRPSGRWGAAAAYDSERGRVVLYGGTTDPYSGSGTFNDTWEWDGTNWINVTPATGPQTRNGHVMAYDRARKKVVLFGGSSSAGYLADTWEWDGTNWAQVQPTSSPTARGGYGMTYDETSQKVVLFGGSSSSGILNETWTWNGMAWTQLLLATSPPVRSVHSLIYDSARGRLVLFGGANNTVRSFDDTWEYADPAIQTGPGFTVNKIGDTSDGTCTINDCTLREAITTANARSGSNTITFSLPETDKVDGKWTIRPTSPLPAISEPVSIDGASSVILSGTSAGNSNGLTITSSDSVIKGLHFTGWSGDGIRVQSGTKNNLRGNTFSGNVRLGINLMGGSEDSYGVTTNDVGDADTGANELQNAPVVGQVSTPRGSAVTTISGTLQGKASQTYNIDLYSNPAAHASGYGEGATLLKSIEVTVGSNESVTFSTTVPTLPLDRFVSVLTTDALGNSGEFSRSLVNSATPFVSASVTVTAPAHGSGLKSLARIEGTVVDNRGSGIARVEVFLRRKNSSNVLEYWGLREGVWGWSTATAFIRTSLSSPGTVSTGWSLAANSPEGTVLPVGSQLFEGAYSCAAYAYDGAGNKTRSADTLFNVDLTAPASVAVVTPATGSHIKALTSIAGTAIDNSGGSGVARVEVFLRRKNSSNVFEYWALREGTWGWSTQLVSMPVKLSTPGAVSTSWSLASNSPAGSVLPSGSQLSAGTYSCVAYAYDKAGNKTRSTAPDASFKVDATAPISITVTTPAHGSTQSTLESIAGFAEDNAGGIGIARVEVFIRRKLSNGTIEHWGLRDGTWGWGLSAGSALASRLSAPNAIRTNW
ncbi:MAG TPA: CSLREA domain-containing protein, partial [Fibrella sp.]